MEAQGQLQWHILINGNSWVSTWDRLHSHSEEAFDLTLLTNYGHTVYQRHWVQQITQVHESPEEKEKGK